jgi:hypothetical protein
MDRSKEADQILKAVSSNRFILRDHATQRGLERSLSRQNVINVANTLIEWKWQEKQMTYWFIGFLSEGEPGGFTAAIDHDVWIITVFKRKLSKREKELIK